MDLRQRHGTKEQQRQVKVIRRHRFASAQPQLAAPLSDGLTLRRWAVEGKKQSLERFIPARIIDHGPTPSLVDQPILHRLL
jgi:hypothetical protein